jgi:hypothetical protein
MTDHPQDANWNVAEWHGKMLDRDGERIGKLQDVYVDVENDEPQSDRQGGLDRPPHHFRAARRDLFR